MRTRETQVPAKRHARVGANRIAYLDVGDGPPVLLLHGCPFSSFVWRNVIAELRGRFRCLAPDLLGLGDTETPRDADWRLPAQLDPANQACTGIALDGLRHFTRPTLIMWGEHDVHFPSRWGERLHADIPGAVRLVVLPGTGHLLMEEQPGPFAAELTRFLTDLDDSAGEG